MEENSCKFCTGNKEYGTNFLFKPCACKGSCSKVHTQCLKYWMQIKIQEKMKSKNEHFISFEQFPCEICKQPLPLFIEKNGMIVDLLSFHNPKYRNYIVLESLFSKTKYFILIHNVPSQGILIGRNSDCEVHIENDSIQNFHLLIKEENNRFYISDLNSKFGTKIKQEQGSLEVYVCNEPKDIRIGDIQVNVKVIEREEK